MFDVLFASFGPLGSAALLLGMLGVFFAVAATETAHAARSEAPSKQPAELAGGLGRTLTLAWVGQLRRMIARPARARDSRACHAWSARHCVRGERGLGGERQRSRT